MIKSQIVWSERKIVVNLRSIERRNSQKEKIMKKALVIILAVMALALTSCDKDKEQCWRVKVSQGRASATGFVYASRTEMEIKRDEVMKRGYVLKFWPEGMYNNRQDCEANNANLFTDFFKMN